MLSLTADLLLFLADLVGLVLLGFLLLRLGTLTTSKLAFFLLTGRVVDFRLNAGMGLIVSALVLEGFVFLVLVEKWRFPDPLVPEPPPVLGGTGDGYSRRELNSFT